MGTLRFFSGGRDPVGKKSVAQEILFFEVQKKTKLDPQERFKFIMKRKLEEARKKVTNVQQDRGFGRKMSKRAEGALKDVAAKKAAKEAKALRRMVIVQAKMFTNGRLTKKGDIYDIAGNKVAKVSTKDGKMRTFSGALFGRYKPRDSKTTAAIYHAIDQHSPYFINMRKMQAMQAAGLDPKTGQPLNQDTMNVYGASTPEHHPLYGNGGSAYAMLGGLYKPQGSEHFYNNHHHHHDDDVENDLHGNAANGMTRNSSIGASAFGVQSNNVWGNFADNAWGTSFDNVHGTNNQDVWGQATGNPYGSFGKSVQMWGTGSGNNYIKALITRLSQLFGLNTKATRQRIATLRATAGSVNRSSGTTRPGSRPSSSGPRPGSSGGGSRSGSAPAARPSAPVGRR